MKTAKFKLGLLVFISCWTVPLSAQTHGTNASISDQSPTNSSPATAPSTSISFQLSDPLPQTVEAPNVEKHNWNNFSEASSRRFFRPQPQSSVADSSTTDLNFSDQSFAAVSNAVANAVANAFPLSNDNSETQPAPVLEINLLPVIENPLPPLDIETHHEFTDLRPAGIRGHFSDASPVALNNPAPVSASGPLQPIVVAPGEVPGLKLKHISGAKFTDPLKFLEARPVKFASPNQFLDNETLEQESAARARLQLVSSQKKRNPRQVDDGTSSASTAKENADNEDLQRLYVADVYAPISLNPFGELDQVDPNGILKDRQAVTFAEAPAGTYAELTGTYFQAHLASWKAHQLYHKPLYFEETNLERYGNELCYQNVASTIHFFTSAALLPYKIGQTSPNTCVTTLGHHRPGECVPYQVHRGEPSRRGLIYQALPIIAISL